MPQNLTMLPPIDQKWQHQLRRGSQWGTLNGKKPWYKRSRNVWTNSDSCTWLIHLVNWWSSYFGLSSSMLLYNLIRIITQQPNLSTEIMSCKSRPHMNSFAQLKLSSFLQKDFFFFKVHTRSNGAWYAFFFHIKVIM